MPKSLFVLMSPENQAAYQKGRAAGQTSIWSGEKSEEWATGLGFLAGRAYAKDHPEQAPKVVKEEAADETPTAPAPIPPMPASRPPVFHVPTDAELASLPPPSAWLAGSKITDIILLDNEGDPTLPDKKYVAADDTVWHDEEEAHNHERELGLPLTEFLMPGEI